jgi:prepilin-type N-terminal cleavage/methylation domain-containing protein
VRRLKFRGFLRSSELGFTLQEVLIVIALMGIVLAIASSSWFGMIESRRVDSATNQMVSDLRLAHTSATNRLAPWRVVLSPGSANYQIGPTGGTLSTRSLEKSTTITEGTTVTVVEFKSNGEAQITGTGNIKVAAADGSPCRQIEVNTVTSRIKVSSNVC